MKRELHEKGKFDDLKQYWADVKGIEKAQTVQLNCLKSTMKCKESG